MNRIVIEHADPVKLGQTLRELREAKGLSCYGLAKKALCASSTICVIEKAKSHGHTDTIDAILNGLGYRLDIVITEEEAAEDE